MSKLKKSFRSFAALVFAIVSVLTFSGSPVMAATQDDAFVPSLSSSSATTTTKQNDLPLLRGSTEIGSTAGIIHGMNGQLTVDLGRTYWGVDIMAGTYDSNASGSVECFVVKPNGNKILLGTVDAKNDHTNTHYISYCPKGTYTFMFLGNTDDDKMCYGRMFNV